MRILFIDDDPNMHRLIELMLRDSSYIIKIVSSARMALHKLKNNPYDLIISDLQMPEMDGIALLKEMRARNFRQPVIIISAYGLEKMAQIALAAGASLVLEKPFKKDQLFKAIKRFSGKG